MAIVDDVKDYLNKYKKLNSDFGDLSKMYLFTTENIREYQQSIDLNDKNVLTVCGSGDQLLNAYLLGAKKVTCFDINELAYYFLIFKINAICTLNYDEFLKFFIKDQNEEFLKKEYYNKIRYSLDACIRELFDYIFYEYTPDEIYDKFFYNFNIIKKRMNKMNLFFEPFYYDLLKSKIKNIESSFINCNVLELPNEMKEIYDVVLLSNISDSIENMYSKDYLKNYRDLIVRLGSKLSIGGLIQSGYIYECKRKNKDHIFESNSQRKKEFKFGSDYLLEEKCLDGFKPLTTDKIIQVRKLV